MLCHDLLNLEKVLLDKAGGVHFPGTVHQIVCLIDQENIVILCLKGEETLEAGSRIKGIIVIADDRITPGTDVKTHLKRADVMLLCISKDPFARNGILMGQDIVNGIVDPVEMTERPWTGLWVALWLVEKTDFFLSGQCDELQLHAPVGEKREGLLCHGASDCFGGQIEYFLGDTLADGLDGRKHCGDCLAYAGRCFDV